MAETSAARTTAPAERPLSPHLQIYRPMLTMMMSIVHRITGFGLYFGTLLLAWWLIAAARAPTPMPNSNGSPARSIGRLILFGYTWALIHHMLGGIRHLIWDTGRGFGPSEREWLAAANLIGSIAITHRRCGFSACSPWEAAMSGAEAYPHAARRACAAAARPDPAPSISGISG